VTQAQSSQLEGFWSNPNKNKTA